MKGTIKSLTCLFLCVGLLLISIAGCGTKITDPQASTKSAQGQDTATTEKEPAKTEPVSLPFLIRNSGNDSGMKLQKTYIDGFNKEFEGKYKIEVEWMPGVAEDIRAKLKMLNASNDLPALVSELAAEPAFGDLLINNNRIVDLKPYFDVSPEWQKVCFPESIAYNTKDGKMFTSPSYSASYVGIFYNKEHFEKAGITKFPETWDEFWAACDALKAKGYTPLSMHTTETGWCPMLLGTSSLAASDEGKAFMNQKYPTNYDAPVFIESMDKVKKLFTYSTADAVGGNYALAANNFTSEKTSMIPNGPWMIPSLSDKQFAAEGFEDKVGYALMPDGTMLSWLGLNYGDAVSADHPKDVQEGTIEFIKYKARPENIRLAAVEKGDFTNLVPLTEDDLKKLGSVMQEYAKTVASLKNTMIVYQTQWDPIVQNEVIPAELPNLVSGKIDTAQFCSKLAEGAKKYAAENNK